MDSETLPGDGQAHRLQMTTAIVAAYVGRNRIALADLPGLITSTHTALAGLGQTAAATVSEVQRSAVSVRKSLADPNHIISMIDGKPYRSLKRHLSANGLTPDEYRQRFGLAADYPMVAPDYSAKRSALAKSLGLGHARTAKAAQAKPRKTRASKA